MTGNEFVNHVLELCVPLGAVGARRMFGGHGLFLDGLMFAIVVDDALYLKADDFSIHEFRSHGLEPFTYVRAGKTARLHYYQAPEEALETPDQMQPWARRAFAAALRKAAATKKTGRTRRPARTKKSGT